VDIDTQKENKTDAPLSINVVRRNIGWNARAQQYPIFSVTWYKYRSLSLVLPATLIGLFFALAVVQIESRTSYWTFAVCVSSATLITNLFLARGLSTLVCRNKWPQKKIAVGIFLSFAFSYGVSVTMQNYAEILEKKHTSIARQKVATETNTELDRFLLSLEKNNNYKITRFAFEFFLFAWLAGALDVWAYFRQQRAMKDALIEQQLEKYKIERNEAEQRLSLLASQIEPHFLFNTLSGVRSAILSDPQKGVAIIDHLAEYLRYTIPEIRHDGVCTKVKIASQFNAIRAYLGVIQHRIPRLSFHTHFSPELSEHLIPPLMLISLVENAVKHGIELKKGPVNIDVIAEKIVMKGRDYVQLSVVDNGLGFSGKTSGSGIGLTNIRERLRQLYADDASLQLESNDTDGVSAIIRLPAMKNQTQFKPEPTDLFL